MKASIFLPAIVLAVLPFVVAQNGLPECASACLMPALLDSGCKATNQTCLCENPVFRGDMTSCVMSNCKTIDALAVMNATSIACHEPVRNRSKSYVIISNVLGVMSAVFVIQRFAYKIWSKLDLGPDDWFTLAAILTGIPNTVINTRGVAANGLGRDVWTLKPKMITEFTRYFYILEVIYFSEVSLLKLALLFFYIRIFPAAGVRRLLWVTIIINCLFGLSFILVAIFQCSPINYYWMRWDGEHEGTCVNVNSVAWSNAGISISLDVWVLAVPLWQLKKLNLDWRKKIGVGMMFCVGTFITVVSILRLKSLVKFGTDSINPTWDFYDVGVWSTVEINVGIMCVCLPSLRLLLVRLFPRLLGTTQRYYTRYGSGANRSTAKGQSRPMGNTVVSQVDRSEHFGDVEHNRIGCHKSFAVEYGDNDEVQLVRIRDMDRKSSKSDFS